MAADNVNGSPLGAGMIGEFDSIAKTRNSKLAKQPKRNHGAPPNISSCRTRTNHHESFLSSASLCVNSYLILLAT